MKRPWNRGLEGVSESGIVRIPLLSKEGWLRASKKGPRSIAGAAGVVLIRHNHPGRSSGSRLPLLGKEGNAHDSNSSQTPQSRSHILIHAFYDRASLVPPPSIGPIFLPTFS